MTSPPPVPSGRHTCHPSSVPPESVLSPNITWESEMFNVDNILRNLPFPRVVLCDHSSCSRSSSLGFDCSHLLLLYSKRGEAKVSAKGLSVNSSDGKTLMDNHDRIVIPEDYKGWFAVIGSERSLSPIPCYKYVDKLAMSDCHTFLIGGTKNVTAIQKDGGSIVESRELYPGDVLRKGTLDECQRLLHCTDENDRDIFLPLATHGTFYAIKNRTRNNTFPVMQIKEIMSTMKLPCTVKLIHGREPTEAGAFTKLMTLEEVIQDNSILASTLIKPRNTLHELMTDIPNDFKVAVPNEELLQSLAYRDALNLCLDEGDLFMRDIKLSFSKSNSPIEGEFKRKKLVLNPYTPCPSLKTDKSVSPVASHQTDNSIGGVLNTHEKILVSSATQTEDFIKDENTCEVNVYDELNSPDEKETKTLTTSRDNYKPLLLLYPRPNRRGDPIRVKESMNHIHGTSYHVITGEWRLFTEPCMKNGQGDVYENDVDNNCIVQSLELVSSPVPSGLMFSYLPVPKMLTIPGGLYPGRSFRIKAVPLPNPARFILNFLFGPNPMGDVGFQFDVRFNYLGYFNQVIRNHKIGSAWGVEEAYQRCFPFQLNTIFDMAILVEEACFKVRINDEDYCVFNHRIHPVTCLDFLYIEGDISISSLQIS